MDRVKEIIDIDNWYDMCSSFGWSVLEIEGHDIEAIEKAMKTEIQ